MGNEFDFHPYSELFPLITGEELAALKENIQVRGQQTPILLFEGKILDGRNRYRCCVELGIVPEFEQYTGDDALGHVLSLNLYRRQLTVAQRALIAAEFSSLKSGGDKDVASGPPLAIEEASKLMAVSPRSVSSASKVVRDGAPELLAIVKKGEVTVSAAELICKLDRDEQKALCEEGAKSIAKAARDLREESKKPKPKPKPTTRTPEDKTTSVVVEEPLTYPNFEDERPQGPAHTSTTMKLFEMAQEAMELGYEPETLAGQILDEVEDGLDMQLLLFTVDAMVHLGPKLRARSLRK
jgi:ParB family chromosome partitioning protein